MTQTNQGALISALQTELGAGFEDRTLEGLWHELWDANGVAGTTFNERMLNYLNAYLGTSYTYLPQAMQAYAEELGFYNWSSINAWSFSTGPSYAVNNNEPDTVADFAGVLNSGTEYYRVGGSETTFASMFTHARASNATMVDSDGNLKWAPHNLINSSTNLASSWFNNGTTDSGQVLTASAGAGVHHIYSANSHTSASRPYRIQASITPGTHNYVYLSFYRNGSNHFGRVFDLSDGTEGQTNGLNYSLTSSSIVDNGDGSYTLTIIGSVDPVSNSGPIIAFAQAKTGNSFDTSTGAPTWTAAGTETITINWVSYQRFDLGGVVNNPDTGNSHVPTTSAARYLPRRNHYRYNGSSYVKQGILLESAAATNLVADSLGLSGLLFTGGGTVGASATAAPFGAGATVKRVQGSAANDGAQISFTAGSAGTHVAAWYARSRTGAAQSVKTGLSGNVGPTTVLPANGDWKLVWGTAALGAGTRDIRILQVSGNIDIDVAIPQAELGSVPTSYIPTSGATATRAAETLTIAGSNMAYSATAMSFHVQGEVNYADANQSSGPHLYEWYSSSNEQIYHFMDADRGTGGVTTRSVAGGVTDDVESGGSRYSPGLNVSYNHAVRMTTSTLNLATEGTAATANATLSALPGVNGVTFRLGTILNGAGTNHNGTIALFRQWDVDLADSGIESATS